MRWIVLLIATACIAVPAAAISAEDTASSKPPVKREIIPGSELMTSQEREGYRRRIRGAKTPQEEERVRAEHVKQMQERARLRGLELPAPKDSR